MDFTLGQEDDLYISLSASEALFGFAGWLMNEPTILHDAGEIAKLVDIFCQANLLAEPRVGWDKQLRLPVTSPETCSIDPPSEPETPAYMAERFEAELESLINKWSQENGSDTPDFILANYLADCLRAFDNAVRRRETWYK